MTSDNLISRAKKVFKDEIETLETIQNNIENTFAQIVKEIISCKGKIILCGMGKSGHIAKKISATLSSLGFPSFFLHPAEAMHGDLGMVSSEDITIFLSNSGETQEILSILPSLKLIGTKLIALVGKNNSALENMCDITQVLSIKKEACYLNLAPTSSTTAMLVYGDALAVVAADVCGFSKTDFGMRHPAGTLGKKVLMKVQNIMAKNEDIPIVENGCKITNAIMEMSKKGLGVVAIVNKNNKLIGLLTDGDLRRAIEKKVDLYNDIIDSIMTKNPKYITEDLLVIDVLNKLKINCLNNYPVIDNQMRVIGMITCQMIIREGIAI